MADISKIQIEDTVYDIKDETAREYLNPLVNEYVVFVGDSYGVNSTNHDGWVQKYVDMYGLTLGTDALNLCVGNAGFNDINGGTNTYLNNLTQGTQNIDKSKVTKILVAGGYNDRTKSATELEPLVTAFMTYVKSNFPNAKTYIGMIGNDGGVDCRHGTNINYREWIATQVLQGYKSCEKHGAKYLNGVELVMHQYDLFDTYDYIHPNNNGATEIARAIYEAENGVYNSCNTFYDGIALTTSTSGFTKDSNITTINLNIAGYKYQGNFNIKTSGNMAFSSYINMAATDEYKDITVGSYTGALKYFRYTNHLSVIPVIVKLTLYNSTEIHVLNGNLTLDLNGNITLRIYNDNMGTRYISSINVLNMSAYSLPILAQ